MEPTQILLQALENVLLYAQVDSSAILYQEDARQFAH